jgi:dihydrofolate reductase
MLISQIVAVAKNGVIGTEGRLPWRLSADLKNFKKLTEGHAVLMGRKTFESIGKPLPNRKNLILSRKADFNTINTLGFADIHSAIAYAKDTLAESELFVIGGGEIYFQTLALADKIYLTKVEATLSGDTYFPDLPQDDWEIVQTQSFKADEKNDFDFEIVVLERKKNEIAKKD